MEKIAGLSLSNTHKYCLMLYDVKFEGHCLRHQNLLNTDRVLFVTLTHVTC